MQQQIKIVCLGGGIGTVNLLHGLKRYTSDLSVVVSMADDGGSAGRLRRLYQIMPPGDIVSCLAALSEETELPFDKLLTYRFPGDRYGEDDSLPGHKLGNLIMAAATEITGDFQEAISLLKKIFKVHGNIYPATTESVVLSAVTKDGIAVEGEEAIDLGKYNHSRVLDRIAIQPENPSVNPAVIEAIHQADVIITGPGDLYTTLLPVLVIPAVKEAVLNSHARKLFIVNVANKPFETKGYSVSDFLAAVERHLGSLPFTAVLANNNFSIPMPEHYHYTYVKIDQQNVSLPILAEDLVNDDFPLYHDTQKLAQAVLKHI